MIDYLILTTDQAQYVAIESKLPNNSVVSVPSHIESQSRQFVLGDLQADENTSWPTRKVLLGCISDQGLAKVAFEMFSILSNLQPKVVLFVGLASGIKGKVDLGDIVISSRIDEFAPSISISSVQVNARFHSNLSPRLAKYIQHHDIKWEDLLANNIKRRLKLKPKLRFGPIISTNFLSSNSGPDIIRMSRRDVCAVEMESAGIAAAVEAAHKPIDFLSILCITDFVDFSKNDDFVSSGREIAAAFCIALAKSAPLRELSSN